MCPTRAACPTRSSCLGSKRPPSDDVMPPALRPATTMVTEMLIEKQSEDVEQEEKKPAVATVQQVAATEEPGAASLVLVPLDRSLTRDDWMERDGQVKEVSGSEETALSPEPAPAPSPLEPGEEGYVDTGGGILSFLLEEEECEGLPQEEDEVLKESEAPREDGTSRQMARGDELRPSALQHKLGGHGGARHWSGVARSPPTLASIQETCNSRGTEG